MHKNLNTFHKHSCIYDILKIRFIFHNENIKIFTDEQANNSI